IVGVCFAAAVFTWGLGVFGASVYLSEISRAHGWTTAIVSAAITVFYLTNACCLTAVGALVDRWGPRPVISCGALLLAFGVAAIGQLSSLWQLYAAFVCMGLGYATMSVTGLSAAIAPWFERHQGRSVALALTGASIGAMVVVPLLVLAIGALGFAEATLRAGLLTAVVLIPLVLIVLRFRGPGDLGLGRDGDSPEAKAPTGRADAAPSAMRRDALRTFLLWSVPIGFALGLTVQIGFLTHHYALAEPSLGAEGAGWLVGATGFTGLLGRLLLARVADQVDTRTYSAAILVVQAVVLGAMALFPSVAVLIAMSLVYGFCLGQITTLSPIVVRREFGAAAFGAIYGIAGTVIQFCSAFGPAIFGVLVDLFGGYGPVLAVAAGFELSAALVLLVGRARR
ncbi:MAG: MFS transporter, partial [Rhodospirillaceae bacterium]|nr:MFS transporter [Rhodospirillaceae bacterium]